MLNINVRLFEFINSGAGYYHALDIFFIAVTSDIVLIIVGGIVGFYIGVYLPYKQRGAARIDEFKQAAFIVFSTLVTWVIVAIIKVLVAFPRPFEALQNLHTLIALPTDYSFPSGHAAVTMAFATSVYLSHKRIGTLLFAFAFAVGIARIYVGVHYPLDVGVGFLLGYFIPKILGHFFIKKETLQLQ